MKNIEDYIKDKNYLYNIKDPTESNQIDFPKLTWIGKVNSWITKLFSGFYRIRKPDDVRIIESLGKKVSELESEITQLNLEIDRQAAELRVAHSEITELREYESLLKRKFIRFRDIISKMFEDCGKVFEVLEEENKDV